MVLSKEVQKLIAEKVKAYRIARPESINLSDEEISQYVKVTEEDILNLKRSYLESVEKEIKAVQSDIDACDDIIANLRGAAVSEARHEKAFYQVQLNELEKEQAELRQELMGKESTPGSR